MNNFDDFMKQFAKVCREIETAASMASDDATIQEFLSEAGCWEEGYRPEFMILNYLNQYYYENV
jgi:hypothetical protein